MLNCIIYAAFFFENTFTLLSRLVLCLLEGITLVLVNAIHFLTPDYLDRLGWLFFMDPCKAPF
jgi:hypothetical protein